MHSFRHSIAAFAFATFAGAASAGSYSGLYVFGDSLSDDGNIALAVGANPGQVITGNGYIPSQPYASGQFSNGNVWAQGFASSIGLALAPSLAGGTDFAFGGARTTTNGAGLPPSLTSQVGSFLSLTGGAAPSQGLYVIAGGGNDARDALAAAAVSSTPGAVIASFAASYVQGIGAMVDQLQAAGAQRIVVWDVPNLGLAPAVLSLGPQAAGLGSQVALAMNGALSARLAGEGAGVSLFDLYGLQSSFAANPSAFGLTDVTDACGAVPSCDPSSYLFWDGIHPTSAGHALIAQSMLVAVGPVPEPETYALMLAGFVALATVKRRRVFAKAAARA